MLTANAARPTAASLAIVIVGGAAAGCGGEKEKKSPPAPKKPSGIISDHFARTVPIDIGLAQFRALVKIDPVSVSTEHQKQTRMSIHPARGPKRPPKRLRRAMARKLIRRFGPAKNGYVTIPARDFKCLHFRGERPDRYGWKFCFDNDRLEFVTTTGALRTNT